MLEEHHALAANERPPKPQRGMLTSSAALVRVRAPLLMRLIDVGGERGLCDRLTKRPSHVYRVTGAGRETLNACMEHARSEQRARSEAPVDLVAGPIADNN